MSFILRWLLSKWLYAVVIAGALAFLGGVYQAGYNAAWRKAEAETKQVEIDTLKRDIEIARRALQKAEADRAELEQARAEDEKKLDELERLLADRPADAGRGLTDAELGGLLGIK